MAHGVKAAHGIGESAIGNGAHGAVRRRNSVIWRENNWRCARQRAENQRVARRRGSVSLSNARRSEYGVKRHSIAAQLHGGGVA
jgi:hypothetical protein